MLSRVYFSLLEDSFLIPDVPDLLNETANYKPCPPDTRLVLVPRVMAEDVVRSVLRHASLRQDWIAEARTVRAEEADHDVSSVRSPDCKPRLLRNEIELIARLITRLQFDIYWLANSEQARNGV